MSRSLGIDGGIDDASSHDDDVMRPMLNSARASFDVIKANPVAQMSEGRTYGWMHRHLPSGCWNLEVPEVLDQLAKACVEMADFLLIPHRQKSKLNGQMSDGIANPRRPDEGSISMHPADALLLGLHDGGRARVSTTKGMLEAPVRFDSRYRRGVVSVPHGFCHINVNVLTDARSTDPLSGMVFARRFADFVEAGRETATDVSAAVSGIMADVRARGDAALIDLARRFDRMDLTAETLRFTAAEIAEAQDKIDSDLRAALELAAERIRACQLGGIPIEIEKAEQAVI